MTSPSQLAKLTPPALRNAYPRSRLFSYLERVCTECSAIWIDAPPGAGKSVAAAGFLQAQGRASLWFQLDAADSDPSTFFHYLGMAAGQMAPEAPRPPHFTAEYAGGAAAFSRNFFRELWSRLSAPFIAVFDNYQELADESPLHELLRVGLEELPPGGTALMLSREAPPSSMARLLVHRKMVRMGWDDIRLTEAETGAIAQAAGRALDASTLVALHARAEGWAVGVVLLLDQPEYCAAPVRLEGEAPEILFNYFAEEVFARTESERQEFLLISSVLPKMEPGAVADLTGHPDPEREFGVLIARNFFVYRHADGLYQYHPLFRAFLSAKLCASLSKEALGALQRRAAGLLGEAGAIEDAAELLIAARDGEGLQALILRHAQALLGQGRSCVLMRWITACLGMLRTEAPELRYWLGLCLSPAEPSDARQALERAYAGFAGAGDVRGQYLAWCAIVDTFVFAQGRFAPLDRWIEEAERLRSGHPVADASVAARFDSRMFLALMRRRPERKLIAPWKDRAWDIVMYHPDAELRMEVCGYLLIYQTWWLGEFSRAELILDSLRSWVESERASPPIRAVWGAMASGFLWMRGENEASLALVRESLEQAAAQGVHVWDQLLWCQALCALLSSGHVEEADVFIARMEARLPAAEILERAMYHYFSGWRHFHRQEAANAVQHLEAAVMLGREAGFPFVQAGVAIDYSRVLYHAGQADRARAELAKARMAGQRMDSRLIEYRADLLEAEFALHESDAAACSAALRRALAIGRAQDIRNHAWWHSPTMAKLYVLALEQGLEPDYVRSVIRQRRLACPEDAGAVADWPWTLKIRALGGLEIWIDGKPMDVPAKAGKKPIELLVALITHKGRPVPAERLAEVLWPDSDGDRALNSYHVTLKRLRELLGVNVLIQQSGQLRLDAKHCWVDCWALLHGLNALVAGDRAGLARLSALYRGDFLPEEEAPHVVGFRAWLNARYRSALERIEES
ncbi:MAG: winged helix-turn-helix domain-containing protein [Methylococcus sp.]|nr:winged helix-turn-helix domain-containing protein [Methylococcus sp.]